MKWAGSALRRGATSGPVAARPSEALEGESAEKPSAIAAWERELFELLIAHPECIESVRSRMTAVQLASASCRRIYEACCRLADEGAEPAFDRLMLEFDEPAMKSLLVELDENGQAKGRQETDPSALLDELLRTLSLKETEKQRPAQIVALREGGLDAHQQAAMLEAILRQERNRHGISEPTDG